jgi:hypothetical protein
MQLTDKLAFKQLLTGIGLLYGKTLHEAVLAIWWQALKHCEFSEVRAALNAHVVNPDKGQFMPKPADVIEYLQGSSEAQALKAWAEVTTAIREIGRHESVIFPDPLIHAVIRDMGGWIALCQSKLSDFPFLSREFEKRYRALLHHPPLECPHQLTGLFEQNNRLHGYASPEPVLVGQVKSSTKLEDNHA